MLEPGLGKIGLVLLCKWWGAGKPVSFIVVKLLRYWKDSLFGLISPQERV